MDELRQQRSRKRNQTDRAQKCNMNPCKIPVGTGKMVELGLLADPEDAECHHAHEKNQEPGGQGQQNAAEVMFRMDEVRSRYPEIEDQQRHGDGEDSITQRSQALDTLSGNTVVERRHRRSLAALGARGKKEQFVEIE